MSESGEDRKIVYPAVPLSAGTHTLALHWPRTDVGRPVVWLDGEPLPDPVEPYEDPGDPYEESE
jgi:hypothetical protein